MYLSIWPHLTGDNRSLDSDLQGRFVEIITSEMNLKAYETEIII